ncbi:MAG: phosphate acyltransferase [Lentimicrobium sp.]
MITNFTQLVDKVKTVTPQTIAVVAAEDHATLGAIHRAISTGFAKAILFGNQLIIESLLAHYEIPDHSYTIIHQPNEQIAVNEAVTMVNQGKADILMKGIIGTDIFLKAVLDKTSGLLNQGEVMTYVAAMQIPTYHKLLFISDTAVIPYPDLNQKVAMLKYSVEMAKRFGISKPKVAFIGASEKAGNQSQTAIDASIISKMAQRGQLGEVIVDGPLDIFLATQPESLSIKRINTPIEGDADILIFPSLESCNAFYKGLVRFAGAELAGLIQGTRKPVVLMSRSESENSKFYCLALACLMSNKNR